MIYEGTPRFAALLDAYSSFLSRPSPKCILKHPSISTATPFSWLCDYKSQNLVSVLFFIHFNALYTKRPETSFYSINQITWTPDYTSLWLPNTVFNKTRTLSVSHKALLALSLLASLNLTTLPLDHAPQPEVRFLHFWAHSFHSSGHFHRLFPLSGTLFLQIYMGHLFPITQGSPHMSLPQRSHSGILANRRKDPSCPTIFT